MGVTAIVMAGGKGTRMRISDEKPLLRVDGKPVIEIVLSSLMAAKRIDHIVVAVSYSTPKTATYVSQFPVEIIETPGSGYIEDMQFVVRQLNLGRVLTVAADLPLLSSKIVDEIVLRFEKCGKPALAVMAPLDLRLRHGLCSDYTFEFKGRKVVPVGINAIDGKKINEYELEQELFVMNKQEVAININTPDDLNLAEKLIKNSKEL